jgi:hypothetical protein
MNIYQQKLTLLGKTSKARKSFMYVVREAIKKLSEENFTTLAITTLHCNHSPILEEYLRCSNEWKELPHTNCKEERVKSLKYLIKSYRKTITVLLTEDKIDGYSAELVEWLVMNNFWN